MKLILSILLASSILLSDTFSKEQISVIRKSYNIGKQFKARDGMTFENTLASLVFTESSAGKFVVGDRHNFIENCSLGYYQIRLDTAKWIIKKDSFLRRHFKDLRDDRIISLLLTNQEFGALISGTLLKFWYNYALSMNIKKPWEYAVSRYNGGIHNIKYINRIRKNMKKIKDVL